MNTALSIDVSDPALETLWLPLIGGPLAWPREGGALFLGARDGWPLHQRAFPGLVCSQSFKPAADALVRSGLSMARPDETHRYPLVLLLPPRQREEARALYAQAVAQTRAGGRVLAGLRNDEGARSGEADLTRLAGPLGQLSKHKCRAFWTAPLDGPADSALFDEWLRLDAPRPIADLRATEHPRERDLTERQAELRGDGAQPIDLGEVPTAEEGPDEPGAARIGGA